MTLMGIIMVLLFSTLKLATRSWDAADFRTEQTGRIRRIQSLLRRQIEFLQPNRSELTQNMIVFNGTHDNFKFTAPAPAYHLKGGLYLHQLSLVDTEESKGLQLQLTLEHPDVTDNDEATIKPVILLNFIEKIKFSYFGSLKIGETFEWHAEWTEQNRLPKFVKLSIERESKYFKWPDMVVPIYSEQQSQIMSPQ